jgi:flagellar biosynthesis/type III secretory pathway M-ring protein FliF/YscJ
MKRLLALVAGGLGLRALIRRRSRPALSPSPAEDLRAKLAQAKEAEPAVEPAIEPAAEPQSEPEPAQPETVEDRRADVHARARQAIDDLGK